MKTDTQTDLSRLWVYAFSFVLMCLASNITRKTVRYTLEGHPRAIGGNVEIILAFLSNDYFQMAFGQIQMIKVLYNLHSLQLGHVCVDSLQLAYSQILSWLMSVRDINMANDDSNYSDCPKNVKLLRHCPVDHFKHAFFCVRL